MTPRCACCLLACLWLSPDVAAAGGEPGHAAMQGWRPVAPALLEAQRGGFVTPSGLRVSFGFERTVHVNGALVSVQRVQVADVGRITAEEAAQLATLGQTRLVRIGGAGALPAPVPAGLVIQNALDGQRIQVQGTLEVGSNAPGLLQALNTAQTLQAASTASRAGL